jgi:hypothetical protein
VFLIGRSYKRKKKEEEGVNKTDLQHITEILLKVALNNITPLTHSYITSTRKPYPFIHSKHVNYNYS